MKKELLTRFMEKRIVELKKEQRNDCPCISEYFESTEKFYEWT